MGRKLSRVSRGSDTCSTCLCHGERAFLILPTHSALSQAGGGVVPTSPTLSLLHHDWENCSVASTNEYKRHDIYSAHPSPHHYSAIKMFLPEPLIYDKQLQAHFKIRCAPMLRAVQHMWPLDRSKDNFSLCLSDWPPLSA